MNWRFHLSRFVIQVEMDIRVVYLKLFSEDRIQRPKKYGYSTKQITVKLFDVQNIYVIFSIYGDVLFTETNPHNDAILMFNSFLLRCEGRIWSVITVLGHFTFFEVFLTGLCILLLFRWPVAIFLCKLHSLSLIFHGIC